MSKCLELSELESAVLMDAIEGYQMVLKGVGSQYAEPALQDAKQKIWKAMDCNHLSVEECKE